MSPLSTVVVSAAKLTVVMDRAVTAASSREIAFFIFYLLKSQSAALPALLIIYSINRSFPKRKRET